MDDAVAGIVGQQLEWPPRTYTLALAGVVTLSQGGEYPHGGEQPGQQVDDRDADLRRRFLAGACDAHQAAEGLDQQVIARKVAPRSHAERGDAAVDKAGVALAQRRLTEAETVHRARPEVLHQDIRADRQGARGLEIVGVVQVQHDAALVAVDRQVVGALAAGKRRRPRSGVVAFAALHLDHLCTEVAEDHRAERAGQEAREVGHDQPAERRLVHDSVSS